MSGWLGIVSNTVRHTTVAPLALAPPPASTIVVDSSDSPPSGIVSAFQLLTSGPSRLRMFFLLLTSIA